MKNTAGRERNISFTSGVLKKHFKSSLSFSNVYSKMGFFPGSHGIPDARGLAHDGSYRNIDLPFQMVNHIKLISNTKIYLPAGSFDIDLAYQNNFRQEWSEFHTHYPAQDPPDDNTDLELQFNLHTISGNFAYKQIFDNSELQLGLNTQLQQNRIEGYMFLLPEYERKSAGLFVHNKYTVNSNFTLSGGLRFDYGSMHIRSHFSEYAERYKSPDFKGDYYDFTWALGMSYRLSESLNFKSNVGKSFRMPNAVELSANGIHHGSFRYEVGDTAITSEYSYQLDIGLYFKSEKWRFEFSPFINYFPNFIFLSPSGSYLHPSGEQIREADAGQVWQYRQSEAFRAGSELFIKYRLLPNLHVSTGGQYVYATDFSYPIPFTPPFSLHSQLEYSVGGLGNILQKTVFRLSSEYSAAQNRNARNELPTPAYHLLDASLSSKLNIFKYKAELSFQVHNIFDRRYFNHLSFYRLIELPEAGRNYQLMLELRF